MGLFTFVWAKIGSHLDAVQAGTVRILAKSAGSSSSADLTAKLRRPSGNWPFSYVGTEATLAHALKTYPELMQRSMTRIHMNRPWCGNTLLLESTLMSDAGMVRAILEAGHDPNYYSRPGGARLRGFWGFMCRFSGLLASIGVRSDLTEMFAYSTRATPLHGAVVNGNLFAVEILLEYGADPCSTCHPIRMMPHMLAAKLGHRDIVFALLRAGAPATAKDSRGRTAAVWARRRKHAELAAEIENYVEVLRSPSM